MIISRAASLAALLPTYHPNKIMTTEPTEIRVQISDTQPITPKIVATESIEMRVRLSDTQLAELVKAYIATMLNSRLEEIDVGDISTDGSTGEGDIIISEIWADITINPIADSEDFRAGREV